MSGLVPIGNEMNPEETSSGNSYEVKEAKTLPEMPSGAGKEESKELELKGKMSFSPPSLQNWNEEYLDGPLGSLDLPLPEQNE